MPNSFWPRGYIKLNAISFFVTDTRFSLQKYIIGKYFSIHCAQCSFKTECSIHSIPIEKERIFMKIASAVLGGGLMTLCLPTPGTAEYIIFL